MGWFRPVLLGMTGAAVGVLIAAELAPLLTVRAGGMDVSTVRAGDHHGYALGLLALVALALAGVGTRPALLGLAVVGLAALAVVMLVDRPETLAAGVVSGVQSARAHARVGIYLERGGALARWGCWRRVPSACWSAAPGPDHHVEGILALASAGRARVGPGFSPVGRSGPRAPRPPGPPELGRPGPGEGL